MRPQRVGLEYQVQAALGRLLVERVVTVDNLAAVNGHVAVLRLFQAGDDTKRGRLAAAGGTQQGHEIAVLNDKVDITQDVVAAVEFVDML